MFGRIFDHILAGDASDAAKGVQQALASWTDPAVFLNQGMIATVDESATRFEAGDICVPARVVAKRGPPL